TDPLSLPDALPILLAQQGLHRPQDRSGGIHLGGRGADGEPLQRAKDRDRKQRLGESMSRNNKEPGDFGVPSISPLYVQGMNVSDITHLGAADLRSQLADPNERFWATPPRALNSRTDDILILKFPSKKLINYISFERAAFPHRCQVWYLTNEPEWLIGGQRLRRRDKRALRRTGRTTARTYRRSVPYIPNRAEPRQAEIHPHPSGAGHWLFEEFARQSVETEAIAITLNRNVGSDQR